MLAEMLIGRRNAKLTLIERIHATTNADLVGQDDTREHSENRGGDPPTDRVAKEVDLLPGLILSPEAHTAQKERPLNWLRSVGVA